MKKTALIPLSLSLVLTALPAAGYDLFDPVPADQLRDLSPDRPDTTESPITVDAGHIQIEASLFDWRRERRDDVYTAMSTNFKVGLTDCTDLQVVFDSYIWENNAGPVGDADGFGDVTLRYKWNLWGNDGGDTALALFPFVKVPTGTSMSNDKWEGGLIVPFSMDLREGLGLGLMAELDYVDDGTGTYDFEFVHTAVLGFDLTEKLGCFIEYVGILGEDRYEAYASGGLTYSINSNLMLDCGTQVGLNDDAEDIGLFSGFTVRF
jgi:hypothetical protein